jgi:hypothetical protein
MLHFADISLLFVTNESKAGFPAATFEKEAGIITKSKLDFSIYLL